MHQNRSIFYRQSVLWQDLPKLCNSQLFLTRQTGRITNQKKPNVTWAFFDLTTTNKASESLWLTPDSRFDTHL